MEFSWRVERSEGLGRGIKRAAVEKQSRRVTRAQESDLLDGDQIRRATFCDQWKAVDFSNRTSREYRRDHKPAKTFFHGTT